MVNPEAFREIVEKALAAERAARAASGFNLQVPFAYGYVVLAVGVGSFVVTTMMGGPVRTALWAWCEARAHTPAHAQARSVPPWRR